MERLVALLAVMLIVRVAAAEGTLIRRVRSERAAIAALIEQGFAGSTTFKSLVATIDQTDGLVYIDEGKCGHSVHVCLVLKVTIAGPNRILHILIDLRRPQRRLIASIGHELRHAIEVLNGPAIRSNAEMFQFFGRVGPTGREIFETREAVQAGLDVYAELGSDKTRR
jgi:hypothetical protein